MLKNRVAGEALLHRVCREILAPIANRVSEGVAICQSRAVGKESLVSKGLKGCGRLLDVYNLSLHALEIAQMLTGRERLWNELLVSDGVAFEAETKVASASV